MKRGVGNRASFFMKYRILILVLAVSNMCLLLSPVIWYQMMTPFSDADSPIYDREYVVKLVENADDEQTKDGLVLMVMSSNSMMQNCIDLLQKLCVNFMLPAMINVVGFVWLYFGLLRKLPRELAQ